MRCSGCGGVKCCIYFGTARISGSAQPVAPGAFGQVAPSRAQPLPAAPTTACCMCVQACMQAWHKPHTCRSSCLSLSCSAQPNLKLPGRGSASQSLVLFSRGSRRCRCRRCWPDCCNMLSWLSCCLDFSTITAPTAAVAAAPSTRLFTRLEAWTASCLRSPSRLIIRWRDVTSASRRPEAARTAQELSDICISILRCL